MNKITLYNITEFTITRFLYSCILGNKNFVLSVDPILPFSGWFLRQIVSVAYKCGRARDAIKLRPELSSIRTIYAEIYLYNIFGQTERKQNEVFHFDIADRSIPEDAAAYKKVTCNYMAARHLTILMIAEITDKMRDTEFVILGLMPATKQILEEYTGRSYENTAHSTASFLFGIINCVQAACILLFTWLWIARHTRPLKVKRRQFFLAADYINDPRDHEIYRECSQGGDVLLVKRKNVSPSQHEAELQNYMFCRASDGRLDISAAMASLARTSTDTLKFLSEFSANEPAHFFQIASLPYRRVKLQALFNRYCPKFYWGRDEYNVEHILRRQELNKVGAKSFGILHSLPTYCDHFPMWRHISHDRFYVFGRKVHEQHRDTWAPDMEVVPVGSFGMNRDDYKEIGKSLSRDIGVFAGIFTNIEKFVEIVREIAETYPNRKVYLQVKSNYAGTSAGKKFIAACQSDLPNVIHTTDPLFTIFRNIGYVFSDPSTVVVEALQFGLMPFMLDISPKHQKCVYREYDGLCVKSGTEAIARIREIEADEWVYPRDEYGELIDLSGKIVFDVIANDMGLETLSSG